LLFALATNFLLVNSHLFSSNGQIQDFSFKQVVGHIGDSSGAIGKLDTLPNLIPETVLAPPTLNQMLKGYTFIFGSDIPEREALEDSIMVFENSFIIYRDIKTKDKVGRIALDVREFGWKCGSKNVCSTKDLLSKMLILPDELDVKSLKTELANFLNKIKGNTKVCHGDTYFDKLSKKNKALIVCFNSQEGMDKLKESFNNLNSKDLPKPQEKIDPSLEKTFTVYFTDGLEAFLKKTLTFKADGIYEGNALLFRYEYLEPIDGKKCEVLQKLPLFPLKFLDNKILSSKCLLKFIYDKTETFLGNVDDNCEAITKYIANKMKTNCLNYINGPEKKFVSSAVSLPKKGQWKGVIHYHNFNPKKVSEVKKNLFNFQVNQRNILIFSDDPKDKTSLNIEFEDIRWACNNKGECNIWEYLNYLKRLDPKKNQPTVLAYENQIEQIRESWGINDINFCLVIDATETHIICPRDASEEISLRTAISVSTDNKLIDAEASLFKVNDLKEEYSISHVTDSNPFIREYQIKIKNKKVVKMDNHQEGEEFLNFKMMQSMNNVPCGFEFRHLSLPIAFHEFNPLCCAKYITDENNYICIQNQAKCYIQLRRMLNTMQSRCLIAKGLIKEKKNKKWKGKIIYNEIDNYKYKGESNIKKGILEVNDSEISINDNTNPPQNFKFNLLTLKFICLSEYLCSPNDYNFNQEPFLQKGYDKEWQESTFTNFWTANKEINQDDCLVLTTEDQEKEVSQMVLVCTEEKEQGLKLKKSISESYSKMISNLTDKNPEFKKIPSAHLYSNYKAYIITSDPKGTQYKPPTSKSTIVINSDSILLKDSGNILFKYENILDLKNNQINLFWDSPLKKVPKNQININTEFCFSALKEDNLINICFDNKSKSAYEKASLFQAILTRSTFVMGKTKKNESYKEYLKNLKPRDPFNFIGQPNYKKFPKTFNTDLLNQDTFDVAKNGIWEGWVYEGTLTERNFKRIFTPVYMQLSNGFITFRTNQNTLPYKLLKLYEYNQICKGHCKPDDYSNFMKTYRNDLDDVMYFDKSVINYLGQMRYPYITEGCVVMDFMSPVYQIGQQHMICAVEKTQGQNIRNAIDNNYYTSLLNMDMDKEVRKPNVFNDKYFARLIVNDKLVEKFNNFYLDEFGLVGRKIKEKMGTFEEINKNVFNITYAEIDKDNYGKTCAFWYKGLKIKQRDQLNNTISDNNCCFRFHTKTQKQKVEICTFTLDDRICIKDARELMKGIKSGCIDVEEANQLPDNFNENEKENQMDMYIENTIDDNENGIFEGFAHFANAINSSQQPRPNPYFIKIGKSSIDIFDDFKDAKPKYAIDNDNLIFSCMGKLSCSPADFMIFAQTHKQYIPLTNNLKTIYNLFKDTFAINEKDFNQNCFVMETTKIPILICPFKPTHGILIKKAVANSFQLKFPRQKIATIPNPSNSKPFNIIIKKGLTETVDTVELKTNGLFSTTSKNIVFPYASLEDDPVTKTSCAIWYKSLKAPANNENEAPKVDLLNKNCCIRILVMGNIIHICSNKKKGICVEETFSIMKAIYNGCKYSNPKLDKLPKSPDSEILGQKKYIPTIRFNSHKERYVITPKEREKPIFPYNQIKRKLFFDSYNEISYSKKRSLYQGWVNVYPLPINEEPKFEILKYYARISPEVFEFFESSKEKSEVKMSIRPDMLSQTCRNSSCKVFEYLEKFLSKFDKKFAIKKNYYKAKFNFYEMGKDDGCTVLENFIKNQPKYYIICPRFKFHRSMNRVIQPMIDNPNSTNKKNRILLSASYGKVLREIIFNAYTTSRKFIKIEQINDLKGEIKHAKISLNLKKEEYPNVTISDEGIVSEKTLLIKFDDMPNCMINFNLVYVPKEMYTFQKKPVYNQKKQTCCVRYLGQINQEYICFGDLNCEYVTFKFAHLFNSKCSEKKKRENDDVYNEMNAGNNISMKPLIIRAFKEELKISNMDVFIDSQISTEDNMIKQKSLIIKYMYEIRDNLHDLNKIDIVSSNKIQKGKEDTTMADPKMPTFTTVEPKYLGYNLSKDWEVSACKNRITKYTQKKNEFKVFVVEGDQFIKTKNYIAIISKKSKYFAIRYTDEGKTHLAELDTEFKILANKNLMNPEVSKKIDSILKMLKIELN
jgi:hypothetical protein